MRLAGAALLLVLAAGCSGAPTATSTSSAAPGPAPSAAPLPAPPVAPPPAVLAGETSTVTRVIDGDTFEIGPRTIRVLGIDSCETSTDAGDSATAQARSLLLAGPITLAAEPGVGADRYDRELRYVRLAGGRDFATTMVAATHTAVYEGDNDASADYVARLRAADPNGRTCDEPEPTTTTTPPEDNDEDEADVPDVDAPNRDRPNRRSGGRVGRDGDGDGLCNESTVPVPC